MKKFEIAKQKSEYTYVKIGIISTNCTDKTNGHSYYWCNDKNMIEEILLQHPS
jgi:hypothetical protein